jgi:nucleotide-binding universal stress UspA family protein
MLQIGTVLYPTDFSKCAKHALPFALRLAECYGSDLHLLHATVLHEGDPGNAVHRLPNMEELYQLLEQHAEDQMKSAFEGQGPKGLTIHHAQVRGISAAGAILDYAAQNDIDLVVMGTHGRRGLRRLLLGSVAEEVVRVSPCPVLTVPEAGDVGDPARIQKILIPVDFSEHSRLALKYAHELASGCGAKLHLLHVVDEVVTPDFYPSVMPADGNATDDLREQSIERMKELISEMSPTLASEAEVHVRSGRAAQAITDFAAELGADMLVIASHGLTGISHMLLGSVTELVVRRAHCPVFTVKGFGKVLFEGADD